MIFDSLTHCDQYAALHPLFPAAFAFLEQFDPETPDGMYELEGRALFAIVERFQTTAAESRQWEAHQLYADIQLVVSGCERMLYNPVENLRPLTPYDAAKDVAKFELDGAGTALDVAAGKFCVFFPQDGHKPKCQAGQPETVLKVVVKVRLE